MLMGKEVLKTVRNEICNDKYYSIIVESTQDSSHIDQLTFIMRYTNGVGEVVERFLYAHTNHRHTGVALRHQVFHTLEELQIYIINCRGQIFDNAANMKGQYNGLQAHIKAKKRSS